MQRLVNVAGLQVHHGAGFEVANEKDPVRWRLVGVLGSSPTLALVGGFLHDPAGKVMQLGAVEQLLCIQCPGSPVVELCDLRARDVERMAQCMPNMRIQRSPLVRVDRLGEHLAIRSAAAQCHPGGAVVIGHTDFPAGR